jgi:hypothetical protein
MWADRTTVKKGDAGEALVDAYLIGKNIIPYRPVFDGAHPFDRLLATPDKKQLFIADVKTKARRNHYPDTGIDVRHFEEYLSIAAKHNLLVFLFFVDELERRIYGGWLADLNKQRTVTVRGKDVEYPLTQHNIIYFPLAAMKPICELSETDSEILKGLSTRTHDYAIVQRNDRL